jgi:hypothetical protein
LSKYHVNPKTGQPGVCHAKERCPFASDREHYRTQEAATDAYERRMNREIGGSSDLHSTITPMDSAQYLSSKKVNVAELPEGEYFIGDPFVILGEKDQVGWNSWVKTVGRTTGWENSTHPLRYEKPFVGAFYNGTPVVAIKSLYGDGTYYSIGDGIQQPSDSGLIGIMSTDILKQVGISPQEVDNRHLGKIQTFDQQIQLVKGRYGVILAVEDISISGRLPETSIFSSKCMTDANIKSLETRRYGMDRKPNDSTYSYDKEYFMKYLDIARNNYEKIRATK